MSVLFEFRRLSLKRWQITNLVGVSRTDHEYDTGTVVSGGASLSLYAVWKLLHGGAGRGLGR